MIFSCSYILLRPTTFLASKPVAQLAISRYPSDDRYRDRIRVFSVLTSRPNNYHFDSLSRQTDAYKLSSRAPFICNLTEYLHSLPSCNRIACVLAERSHSAPQALGNLLAMAAPAR
eukprot:6190751-Pleurochrysis_carterae.AAC.4